MLAPKIKRYTPASGDTITMDDFDQTMTIIISPTTDIATLSFVWPANPQNGQLVNFLSTKNIASTSHSGGILNSALISMRSGGSAAYEYDSTGLTWMGNGINNLQSVVSLPFSASVAGGAGNTVFYPTDTGLVGGTALFSSIQSVEPIFDVGDPLKAFSKPVVSNANKTITIPCKISTQNLVTILGVSVIGSTTLSNAADGTALTILVHGVLT